MFIVTEAEAAAIRAVYEQRGEFSAAVELRRLFPGITDTAQARACARTIAGWKPLPVPLRSGKRRDPQGSVAPRSAKLPQDLLSLKRQHPALIAGCGTSFLGPKLVASVSGRLLPMGSFAVQHL